MSELCHEHVCYDSHDCNHRVWVWIMYSLHVYLIVNVFLYIKHINQWLFGALLFLAYPEVGLFSTMIIIVNHKRMSGFTFQFGHLWAARVGGRNWPSLDILDDVLNFLPFPGGIIANSICLYHFVFHFNLGRTFVFFRKKLATGWSLRLAFEGMWLKAKHQPPVDHSKHNDPKRTLEYRNLPMNALCLVDCFLAFTIRPLN